MDTTPVTKSDLTDALKQATNTIVDRIIGQVALKGDVDTLSDRVGKLETSVSIMISGQDKYLKKTQDWKQEQDVLAAQHKKLKTTLINKGVVSEQELAV